MVLRQNFCQSRANFRPTITYACDTRQELERAGYSTHGAYSKFTIAGGCCFVENTSYQSKIIVPGVDMSDEEPQLTERTHLKHPSKDISQVCLVCRTI